MQVQHALYDLALAGNTFSHYVNSLLFMTAVVMANSKEEEAARMAQYITTKAAEIRKSEAAQPKET